MDGFIRETEAVPSAPPLPFDPHLVETAPIVPLLRSVGTSPRVQQEVKALYSSVLRMGPFPGKGPVLQGGTGLERGRVSGLLPRHRGFVAQKTLVAKGSLPLRSGARLRVPGDILGGRFSGDHLDIGGVTRGPVPGGSRPVWAEDFYLPPSPPSPARYLFTRQEHGGNKARNWSLSPSREVLILGASNISRLPLVHDPRVQVDSFPGANLTQAATIIRKNTVTSPGLQKVVLLFGLSDWNIRDSTLLVNDLRRLLNAARDTFPNADIRVHIINISAHSSPLQMENIRILIQQIFHTHQ